MFTYLFGPVVGVHARKLNVYGELLFGGSNTNGYGNLTKSINARGAQVGDLFMSLIHTCQLCGANSFDYLAQLQRHARKLAARPAEWMLWNYRSTAAERECHLKMAENPAFPKANRTTFFARRAGRKNVPDGLICPRFHE